MPSSPIFAMPNQRYRVLMLATHVMQHASPLYRALSMSDAVPGRLEMIDAGKSGYLFPCGDVDALAQILKEVFADPQELQHLKDGVRRKMDPRTTQEFLDCWIGGVAAAVHLKANTKAQRQ